MEKNVVTEYLERVSKSCEYVGLKSLVQGHMPDAGGQLEPIRLDWLGDEVAARGYDKITVHNESSAGHVNNVINPRYEIRVFRKQK